MRQNRERKKKRDREIESMGERESGGNEIKSRKTNFTKHSSLV